MIDKRLMEYMKSSDEITDPEEDCDPAAALQKIEENVVKGSKIKKREEKERKKNRVLTEFPLGDISNFTWIRADLVCSTLESEMDPERAWVLAFYGYASIIMKGVTSFHKVLDFKKINEVLDYLKKKEYRLLHHSGEDAFFITEDSVVQVSRYIEADSYHGSSLTCYFYDPAKARTFMDGLKDCWRSEDKEEINQCYVIAQTQNGFSFSAYNLKPRSTVLDNYDKEVVEDIKELYTQIEADDPFGRLFILEGPPGTGKTSLIRGLIHDMSKPKFVVIPPYLITQLNSPSMISSLMAEQHNDPRPMVLILEDADECLTKRAGDNISNISAVLNLADGILSDTLDVRIVATTNAQRTDIDPALERSGRIGAYICIGGLPQDHAIKVLERLTDSGKPEEELREILPEEDTILADVYAEAAKINGTFKKMPVLPKKGVVGF